MPLPYPGPQASGYVPEPDETVKMPDILLHRVFQTDAWLRDMRKATISGGRLLSETGPGVGPAIQDTITG